MGTVQLDELYRDDAILDHCRHPRNADVVRDPTISGHAVNPFCGDEVDVQIVVDSGRVSRAGVQGRGCSINQAASSMLSEAVIGRTVEEIEAVWDLFRKMMSGAALTRLEEEQLGELQSLSGVVEFPVRIKCALLSWSAVEEGIEAYYGGQSV
jgi:nitrogen fixation NifU-like protein